MESYKYIAMLLVASMEWNHPGCMVVEGDYICQYSMKSLVNFANNHQYNHKNFVQTYMHTKLKMEWRKSNKTGGVLTYQATRLFFHSPVFVKPLAIIGNILETSWRSISVVHV